MRVLFASLATFASVGCATPATTSGVSPIAETTTTSEDGEVVCRIEQQTGSRVASRICRTAREQEEIDENTRRIVDGRSGNTPVIAEPPRRGPVVGGGG